MTTPDTDKLITRLEALDGSSRQETVDVFSAVGASFEDCPEDFKFSDNRGC